MDVSYSINPKSEAIEVRVGNFTGRVMKDDNDRFYVMWTNGYAPDVNQVDIDVDAQINIDSKILCFNV